MSIINKMFESLTLNNEKFFKLFKQMSNEFQILKRPALNQENNSKVVDSVSKYLKLSFIDIEFSDTGIFRHRNNSK